MAALLIHEDASAAFTDHFDPLVTELQARALALSNSTDKIELKQRKACSKAIVSINKSTKSLTTDLKAAGRAAKILQKAFTNEFGATTVVVESLTSSNSLGELVQDLFTELQADVLTSIDVLQILVPVAPDPGGRAKAQVLLDRSRGLIDDAAAAANFTTRARLLAKTLKTALKGQVIASKAGGFRNMLATYVEGLAWTSDGTAGQFSPGSGAIDFQAVSATPAGSTLTVIVPAGVTGPGSYDLPAFNSSYFDGTTAYLNTGGTLTLLTLTVDPQTLQGTAIGTFSFPAAPVGGGTPIEITSGIFIITDLGVLP